MRNTTKSAERLYLTADRTRVVPEGHKEADRLWAKVGTNIRIADAERFGIGEDGRLKRRGGAAAADSGSGAGAGKKGGKPGGNKQGGKGQNKQGAAGDDKEPKPGVTVKTAAKA